MIEKHPASIDIVRRMIPPDVFLHHVVGPFLTPKEVRLVVQRVWPRGFDWTNHCCPHHPGTVYEYFADEDLPEGEERPRDNDNDNDDDNNNNNDDNNDERDEDDDNDSDNEDAEDNENAADNEEDGNNENGGIIRPPELGSQEAVDTTMNEREANNETVGQVPPTRLVLRCRDCVLEQRNLKRCDHCNVFKRRSRVTHTCRLCPQVICTDCDRDSYEGVCSECTLCAFCREVFPEMAAGDQCRSCSEIYCSTCRDVLAVQQEEVKAAHVRAMRLKRVDSQAINAQSQEAPMDHTNVPVQDQNNNVTNSSGATTNMDVDEPTENDPHEPSNASTSRHATNREETVPQPSGPTSGSSDDNTNMDVEPAEEETVPQPSTGQSGETEAPSDNVSVTEGSSNARDENRNENTVEQENEADYEELDLPKLDKNPRSVQVCRRCNYCYCSTCGFHHQCHCCGCSYWL